MKLHRFSQPETTNANTSRRNFLKLMAGAGAGLTLAMQLPSVLAATEEKAAENFEPNAFVRIGEDNTVTVFIKHLEMGQGTYTGLTTLVAEELDASWEQMKAEGAPANAKKYNNLLWGPAQGTGGSTAIANSFEQLRNAGASARAMLVAAAAEKWKVPANEITVKQGVVSHAASKQQASFGELVALAAKQAIPENVTLKDPKDFIYIGKQNLSRKDRGKNDGSAMFTQDVKLDGMLTAVVAHPPLFGATVKSINDKAAKAIAGVTDVVQIPSGVAVLAKDFWTAKKGRDALNIEWDESKAFKQSSDEIMASYKELAKGEGKAARNDGDVKAALEKAEHVVEASYEFPFLAHAAMEPMNCVVQITEEGCEVWNGEQMQTSDQYAIAMTLGIKPEQVKLNMLFAGGSFGRRANPKADYILEAVNIAKAKPNVPVKMVWTREDDMQGGYYRPMYYHTIRGGLDKEGNLIAWDQNIVGQSILTGTPFEQFMVKDGIDQTSVEGASNLAYQVDNIKVALHTSDITVPVLWWRSVGHTHTAFSTEAFIDELAVKAGKDPVEFRMNLLKSKPRHQGVLKLVAEKADWKKSLPEGWARGVAVHESFNSFAAQVVEVSKQGDDFKIERVVCVIDCGLAVNPDIIRAQMEGGIGFGLSAALVSELTLDKGKVKQSNFHDYQVLRMSQMPQIDVHIMPSAEPATGVGEPGVPPIAPALANALAALMGKRVNNLPLKLA